jgi:integrase
MARKNGRDRGILQRKRKGKLEPGWWVRIVHDGRETWRKCSTKSQARAVYSRLKEEIRTERLLPKAKVAPAITLRAWLARCFEGSTNRGLANEKIYNRRWSLSPLGTKLLTGITAEDLKLRQVRMRGKLKPRPANAPKDFQPQRLWSDSTVNRHFSYLRHVLKLALKAKHMKENLFEDFKFFPEATTTRFLSQEELIRLQGVMDPRDWDVVLLALETGLRREELFKLRWDQVDLESGLLCLPLPKGGTPRYVPLSDQAKRVLRSFDSFLRSPWVFPGITVDKPMDSRAFIRRHVEPALRRAGIVGVSWHTLRHTSASRRIMAGVDLVSVKEILGHRDIQTTLRYSHLDTRHLRAAINQGSFLGTVAKTGAISEAERGGPMQPREILVRLTGFEPVALSSGG